MAWWRRKKKYHDHEIQPDEIFLDQANVSGMDHQQFEGVIEKRISFRAFRFFLIIIGLLIIVFSIQLGRLQIIQGAALREQSENNRLQERPLFAQRGIIYDRHGVELAWNREDAEIDFLKRSYMNQPGFGHILGYVNYPEKDDNGFYWRSYSEGQDGLEKYYHEDLSGVNGQELFEVNAQGELISSFRTEEPQDGGNVTLSIDAYMQTFLYQAIRDHAQEAEFEGGTGIIMDVDSGELYALTNYPEYDPSILTEREDSEQVAAYFDDPQKPFLNRAIQGLYSPGSTVKPFLALAGLQEGLISDQTTIMSTGRIEIPNPYNPQNVSVFRDWRSGGHGPTDVYHAIADSVNTYFYALGGGYANQPGLGITNIESYVRLFDISEPTGFSLLSEPDGVIPNPDWKAEVFDDPTWRLGDTYNTSIGQFGFQVTPIQMVRAMAAIANNGTLVTPHLQLNFETERQNILDINNEHIVTVQRALRQTVTDGTARILDISELEISAKTGTAQVGRNNEFKHSWVLGFFEFEERTLVFAVVMERAPNTPDNTGSAARAFRLFLDDYLEYRDQQGRDEEFPEDIDQFE